MAALKAVGIPPPFRALMWDLETGTDPDSQWLTIAANTLAYYGYDNLVYGSPGGSQIFSEPQAGGVVIRYGQFYGPRTFHETTPPQPPRIHIDDAARLTMPALGVPPGVTIVVDDRAEPRDGPG